MSNTKDLDFLVKTMKSAASPCRTMLRELHDKYHDESSGKVADYIPELATADPTGFGIAIVTAQGDVYEVGDAARKFTIQSISKPFVYGLALEERGRDYVLSKVGVEPSGDAFNAIVLDQVSNRPFNPMVNAGAIATADLIPGKDITDRLKRMLKMFSRYVGHDVSVDSSVFLSERATGHRNRAIAHLMLNFGMITDKVDETLELYFQQCSVEVTAKDLAVMGATLANGGVNPLTGERAIDARYIRDVLSVMYTCGMYDYSGEWAYRIGLPSKSGGGGGIVSVVPGEIGIGVYSPLLDQKGNSVRGIKVCEELADRLQLHAFDAVHTRKPFHEQLHGLGAA